MRAMMDIHHRASRFGSHQLLEGQVIATDGDEGFPVTDAEMLHHLEHGQATAIKAPAPEVTEPPAMETATPVEAEPSDRPGLQPGGPVGRAPDTPPRPKPKGRPKRGRRPNR